MVKYIIIRKRETLCELRNKDFHPTKLSYNRYLQSAKGGSNKTFSNIVTFSSEYFKIKLKLNKRDFRNIIKFLFNTFIHIII